MKLLHPLTGLSLACLCLATACMGNTNVTLAPTPAPASATPAATANTPASGTTAVASTAVSASPGGTVVTPVPGLAAPAPAGMVRGLVGQALLPGTALAGAAVQVFRLGGTEAIASGHAGTNGAFLVDVGTAVDTGSPLLLVATLNGKTTAAVGTAGIVAQGGGNIVAQGGGNIVAQGGGNIVAQGGGNIVAQGGGNIVGQGAGNYLVLDVSEPAPTPLNPASTLTVGLLGPRLRGAGQAAFDASGHVVQAGLADLSLGYLNLYKAADLTVGGAGAANLDTLLGSLDPMGHGNLSDAFQQQLARTNPSLADAFVAASGIEGSAIEEGVAAGGSVPTEGTASQTFAGHLAGDVNPHATDLNAGTSGARNDGENPKGDGGHTTSPTFNPINTDNGG